MFRIAGVALLWLLASQALTCAAQQQNEGLQTQQAQPPASSSCSIPEAAPPDTAHQLYFGKIPAVLKPGDRIEVTVSPDVSQGAISAICFDGIPIPAAKAGSQFTVSIPPNPADPKNAWPAGSHHLSVSIAGRVLSETVEPAPKLTSVSAIEMHAGDKVMRVAFRGEGFDAETPGHNVIRMSGPGGAAINENICWTDADCNAKNSTVRGLMASAGEIIVTGLDPGDERDREFQICVSDRCSAFIRDQGTRFLWFVPAAALFLTLLISGVVVLLASQIRPVVIGAERYLLSTLFIDKETNTYSLSKLQFYLWTFVGVFGYFALTISRNVYQHFGGLPPIPSGLPGIVGIAAGTAIGSQVVTAINGPKGAGQPNPALSDFVTTGEVVAAERVQFFVWTVVGALSFFAIVWVADPRAMTDLPEVPWSLLSISGLSAFGYLGGKLARSAGPVIAEIVASTGPDPATPAPVQGTTPPTYGILEVRGRTLSRDATLRIIGADETPPGPDLDISFNLLAPDPKDKVKRPRIIETDPEAKDPTIAKRLLLVIDILDSRYKQIFVARSEHTLSIANPDSQKAMLKFKVPESQKPS
jgi:hypothetical protein